MSSSGQYQSAVMDAAEGTSSPVYISSNYGLSI